MRLRVRRPPHVPDEIWSAFEQAGTVVRVEQAEKTRMVGEERDPVQAYEDHVQAARAASAALDEAIKHVRTYTPHFLAAIDLSTIKAQLSDEHTAMIAFCITEQGSMMLSTDHLQERLEHDLLILGGPKNNAVAAMFLELLADEQPARQLDTAIYWREQQNHSG